MGWSLKKLGNSVVGAATLGAVNPGGGSLKDNFLNTVTVGGYDAAGSPLSPQPRNYLAGTDAGMQAGVLQGREIASKLYGQNMDQTGQDIQGIKSDLKSRVEGSDPVTEAIKQQAGQSRASTARQFAGRGVAGGVAASGIEQSARQKDIDIAASLYGQNRQNLKDYGNMVGNIASQQGALEMSYGALGSTKDAPTPPSYGGGFMGTVICTELHRQGYFSDETLEKEKEYGAWLIENDPEVYLGYRMWADSVVKVMQKSELFSFIVACVATPWASYVAGNCNLVGMTINAIGAPMCKLVYKLFGRKYGLSNQ